MSRNTVALVQARMASTRLPGKVLAEIEGVPMLAREIRRARRADSIDELVVATTTSSDDDAIERLCSEHGYHCFRGSELDVLDRFYWAAAGYEADIVVRLTGDCPLIDPTLIDQTVAAFTAAEPPVDFASNRLPDQKTFPVGTDTEVCTFEALERAWVEAQKPHHREHVMPYLYEDAERFRTLLLKSETDYSHFRWTVDTEQDLELVRQIYAHFEGEDVFTWMEVIELFEAHPELMKMNADVVHKSQFDLDSGWRDS